MSLNCLKKYIFSLMFLKKKYFKIRLKILKNVAGELFFERKNLTMLIKCKQTDGSLCPKILKY